MKKKISNKKYITLGLFAILVILMPNGCSPYIMTVVNSALIYFVATLGLSLLMGMGGQMSFAPISFMGLGAFVTTQLSKYYGVSVIASIFLSIIVVTVFSVILGLLLFRLSGAYFTFATIGLVQILSTIYSNHTPLSGGPDGISGIPKLTIMGFEFNNLYSWYYMLVAIGFICAIIVERIRRLSLGRSLMSIRDNEVAAQTLGVNLFRTKVIAMAISSGFAGLAGALLAHHNGAVSYSLFTFNTALTFIVMVMLGGVNSTVGTLMGTILVTMLPEWLRPLKEYLKLIYGAGLVLLMIFMPMGLAGLVQSAWARIYRWRNDNKAKARGDSR